MLRNSNIKLNACKINNIMSVLRAYVTIVVSWMDPKLLMKMFTLDSTGMPEKKKKKPTHKHTHTE